MADGEHVAREDIFTVQTITSFPSQLISKTVSSLVFCCGLDIVEQEKSLVCLLQAPFSCFVPMAAEIETIWLQHRVADFNAIYLQCYHVLIDTYQSYLTHPKGDLI